MSVTWKKDSKKFGFLISAVRSRGMCTLKTTENICSNYFSGLLLLPTTTFSLTTCRIIKAISVLGSVILFDDGLYSLRTQSWIDLHLFFKKRKEKRLKYIPFSKYL